jgi:dGTPase
VFSPELSDHFRNRLTHTIEVAQIARTVASALGLNEDLTEALALVHDVGHPPFAHAGEDELNRQMRRFGESFNHNLHGLRIVESFEQRYARFPGLNLTFEVREGIVKHSHDLVPGAQPELEEYLPELRPVLEAQLIDLADEVAYNTADLDDSFSAGMISAEEAASCVPAYREIYQAVEQQFPGATERERFNESLRQLIDWLVSELIQGVAAKAKSAGVSTPDEVRAYPARIAAFTPDAGETSRALKRFLFRRVYSSPKLAEDRTSSVTMIANLFQFFLDQPDRLPQPYRERTEAEPPHRVICDYIAGMTDAFFRRTYEQLITP